MTVRFPNTKGIATSFGQPIGAICQIGYVVEDLEAAIDGLTKQLGIGPWFLIEDFKVLEQTYRGEPTDLHLSIAAAYCGNMMYELILQTNDVPSVYRDVIEARGYGLHHYAIVVEDIQAEADRLCQDGVDIPFRATTTDLMGQMKVVYADTRPSVGAMLELCEWNPTMDAFFAQMRAIAEAWDGSDPIRRV